MNEREELERETVYRIDVTPLKWAQQIARFSRPTQNDDFSFPIRKKTVVFIAIFSSNTSLRICAAELLGFLIAQKITAF